ncbi:MAG: hypothetical protein LASZOEIN_000366 [Candidatus Fervidibacter sp.]
MKKLEGASPDTPKFFGSAGALPSRKPLAIRYSPFADVLGSAGASPSQSVHQQIAPTSSRNAESV